MGEGLAVMMDRLDEVFGGYARHNLSAGVGDTIRARVWITTSGLFSMPPFQAALSAFGVDRQIGRAHVCTPVTNAHLVCRLLLEKKKNNDSTHHISKNHNKKTNRTHN